MTQVTQRAFAARERHLRPLGQCRRTEVIAVPRNEESKMEDRAPEQRPRSMLSEKQVLAIVPIARSTLWRLERTGRFPKGSYIPGTRRKFWCQDEVRAWQDAMDGQPPPRRRRAKKPKPAKQSA
jgi:prophage regulatory protein